MNAAEDIIQDLVADLPMAEQQAAREILRSCQFQDGSEPTLALLRYLHVREKAGVETARAKMGYFSKLVDEMKCRLYEAARIKLSFVFILFLATLIFSFVAASSLMVYEIRMHPKEVEASLGLTDPRLLELERSGVTLRVEEDPQDSSKVGIVLEGKYVNGNVENGGVALTFHKQK